MSTQFRYRVGDHIGGRYLVHKVLQGGMGEVFLCLDLQNGEPYALKTFHHRFVADAPHLRGAFEREVATWVALEKHPNIVRCFYMDTLDQQPFMVLEWVAGEEGRGTDLRGWLRRGPLELKVALEITLDICSGLRHAQAKRPGLVHRDLKPENILVAQGGLAKITDFGLAQIVEEAGLEVDTSFLPDNRQSMVGRRGIAGTPPYMAPEQWRGEQLDVRTDIYALGCILYEIVAGTQPFPAEFSPSTPQEWQLWLRSTQSAHQAAPLPRLPGGLPAELDEVLQQCLAKAQVDRPATVDELSEQLASLYQKCFDHLPPVRPDAGTFTATDYHNRGVTYHALQQYEQALADYGFAIELDPNYALAHSSRGVVYATLKWHERALADHNRAVELDPTLAKAFYNRGVSHTDLKQYESALADYDRAIALDPSLAQAYTNRGTTYQFLKQYERALADYDAAIRLDPDEAHAYGNRGLIHADLKQYELALTDYGRAIELDHNPHLAQAYHNRGNTYADQEQYKLALADYNHAIALDPNVSQVYFSRGNTYCALKQYEQALADFDRAIELDPNDATTYPNRGNAHQALQHYTQALADFDRAVELDRNDAKAYSNRGAIYHVLQQYEQALADLEHALELDPNLARAYSNRGAVYQALQQYTRALADFDRAIALDPKDAQAYSNRGNTQAALQQYVLALADYHRAIELDPDYATAYYNRGNTRQDLQQYAQALGDYIRAIELDPNLAPAYFNIGALLGNQGKLEEALPYLEQAARLGHPTSAQYAALARQRLGIEPGLPADSDRQAFEAFRNAASPETMHQATARFPILLVAEFITAIEQVIAQQVPPEQRLPLQQRLAWLRQLAGEQL